MALSMVLRSRITATSTSATAVTPVNTQNSPPMPIACRAGDRKAGRNPPRFISAYSMAKPIAEVFGVVTRRTIE